MLPKDKKTMLFSFAEGAMLLIAIFLASRSFQDYWRLRGDRITLQEGQHSQRHLIQRYKGLEGEVGEIRTRLLPFGMPDTEGLIPAFVRHVEHLATEEGLMIIEISPGVRRQTLPLTKIPFSMKLHGSFSRIHRFLYRLEKSRPPVHVTRLVLSKREGQELLASLECDVYSAEELEQKPSHDRPTEIALMTLDHRTALQNLTDQRGNIFSYSDPPQEQTARATTTGPPKPRPPALGSPRLSAILYDESNPMAILDGALLKVGDRFRGYTVSSIGKDRMLLVHGDNRHEIILRGN